MGPDRDLPEIERCDIVPRGTVLKWEVIPRMFHVEQYGRNGYAASWPNYRERFNLDSPEKTSVC